MCLYSGDFKTKPYHTVHSKTPEFHNSLVPQAGDQAPLHVNHKMEVHLTQYKMNSTVCLLFPITLQSIGLWPFSFLFNIKNASLGKLKPSNVSLAQCNTQKGTTGRLFFILMGRKILVFRISAHKVQVHKAKKHSRQFRLSSYSRRIPHMCFCWNGRKNIQKNILPSVVLVPNPPQPSIHSNSNNSVPRKCFFHSWS